MQGLTIRTMALALAGVSLTGLAAPFVAEVQAQDTNRREFNIPAQSMAAALETFGRQSGRDILFDRGQVAGLRSTAVRGRLEPATALRRLVGGTGLSVNAPNTGTFVVGRSSGASVSGEALAGSTAAGIESAEDAAITVTGSRIRGGGMASPVVVNSRQQIEEGGFNDLGSFARSLTQNFNGGQNPTVAGGGSQGGIGNNNITGSSGLNLRGLGPDATLTLINGHRVSYDGFSQSVDISAIPVAAIDRVEIVTDGASALYGSDSVAGVANIILRRDFDGLYTSARLGSSTDGGNFQQQYAAVGGTDWGSGGLMIAGDYSNVTSINARNRDYGAGLSDDQTFVPVQEQFSLILTGRQRLAAGMQLELDAQFSNRTTEISFPNQTTSDVFTSGLLAQPETTSFALTPTLRFDLSGGWEAALSGTHGEGNTDIRSLTFSGGALSRETRLRYYNSIDVIEGSAEGPLFHMPGGDARLAVGAGYRDVGLDVNVQVTEGGSTSTTADFARSRSVYFGYGELSIPLVGSGNRLPLVDRLSVSAALRYENYRGIGDYFAPKLGLIYQPHPDVVLRGTWGRSFKTQTLFQEYQVTTLDLVPGFFFSNFPADRAVLLVSGGNQGLRPERSTNWTVTGSVRPLPGLNLEVGYYNIQFRDRVVNPLESLTQAFSNPNNADLVTLNPSVDQLNALLALSPTGLNNITGAPYDPALVGGVFDIRLRNAAIQDIQGVDISADYLISLGEFDSLQLISSASYIESQQQLTVLKPVRQLAGTVFNPPHWRGRAGLTYRNRDNTVSGFINYIGNNVDNRFTPPESVNSFTTVDIIARVHSTASDGPFEGVEATIAISNLFNEQPDIIRISSPNATPYDSTNHSAAGRFISFTLAKRW